MPLDQTRRASCMRSEVDSCARLPKKRSNGNACRSSRSVVVVAVVVVMVVVVVVVVVVLLLW